MSRSALAISLVAHLALAGVAARSTRPIAFTDSALAAVEIGAPEIELGAPPAPELMARAAAAERDPHVTRQAATARVALPTPVAPHSEPAAAAPELTSAPESHGPSFVMTVLRAPALSAGASPVKGRGAGNSLLTTGPFSESALDSPAKLESGRAPAYTAEAMSAGVEAVVPLEIVVSAAGVVVSAKTVQHVGYGLDEAALESVQSYRFSPAFRAGKAVPVRMRWLMRFQLR